MAKQKQKNIKIEDFFNEVYIDFATYFTYRSVASYVDGLKNSQRKVIWTVDKNNIKKDIKVSTLASKTIEQTEYLHGDASMQDVVTNLAKDYTTSNNLNLLEPEGHFGYRTNSSAAAPRYIFTKQTPYFNQLFIKDDIAVMEHQNFEGTTIEPKYMLPIIPMILVNGSVGIGSGFSQKILQRDPKKIIELLKKYLKTGQGFREILPNITGYKGKIYRQKENDATRVYFEGVYKIKNTTTMEITEIPPVYDLVGYKRLLEKLVDTKVIKNYVDASNENEFHFTIKAERTLFKKSHEDILKTFGLLKTEVENFTVITEDNTIKVFENEKELFFDYVDFRLKKYTERKEYLLNKLNQQRLVIEAKHRFIRYIIEGIDDKYIKKFKLKVKSLIINNRKKSEIEVDLKNYDFPLVEEAYDYLLNMAIYNLTKEMYDKLKQQEEDIKNKIKDLEKKSNKDLWLEDLENLKI